MEGIFAVWLASLHMSTKANERLIISLLRCLILSQQLIQSNSCENMSVNEAGNIISPLS
jgi:hypothetical protein